MHMCTFENEQTVMVCDGPLVRCEIAFGSLCSNTPRRSSTPVEPGFIGRFRLPGNWRNHGTLINWIIFDPTVQESRADQAITSFVI